MEEPAVEAPGHPAVVRVRAANASTVEAAGTWNDWEPVPLTRDGDHWVARILLPSGAHRIALRIDGSPWRAPRGTARTVDEFGTESGMVVVPCSGGTLANSRPRSL